MSFLKTVFKLPKFDDDIRDTNFGLKKKREFLSASPIHLNYFTLLSARFIT